jgi:hypothetical protein
MKIKSGDSGFVSETGDEWKRGNDCEKYWTYWRSSRRSANEPNGTPGYSRLTLTDLKCFRNLPQTGCPFSPIPTAHNTLAAPSFQLIGHWSPSFISTICIHSGSALKYPGSTELIAIRAVRHGTPASVSVSMLSAALDMLVCTWWPAFEGWAGRVSGIPSQEETLMT